MATGIFPRTRKEEAAMIAEITMSAVKVEDGMVTRKDTLSQMKEVGKAVEAAAEAAPPEEVDARDMTRMMTAAGAVKDMDEEIRKDTPRLQEEDGKAIVVAVVIVTMMITMMIMTIQDGAVVLVAAVVDGLVTRRDILKHQEEDGAEAEIPAEIMTSTKTRTAMPTMNIQTNTKTRMKMKAAVEVAVDADAGPEAQADPPAGHQAADKDLPA
jgi:hypothetical protein